MKSTAVLLVSIGLFGFARSSVVIEASLEKKCQSPPKDILSKEWLETGVPEGGWYVPLISKNTRSKLSTNVSRNAASQMAHFGFYEKQPDIPFCPRMMWESAAKATLMYYGKKLVYLCADKSTVPCILWQRSPKESTDTNVIPDKVKGIYTLTDNQSYVFMFRCWEDGYNDWQGVSSERRLNEEQKEAILNEVELAGFDREAYYEIDYDKCP